MPGWGVYFYVNEIMKQLMGVTDGEEGQGDWDRVSLMKRMFIGGCAGMACWAVGYPFDVLKTEI